MQLLSLKENLANKSKNFLSLVLVFAMCLSMSAMAVESEESNSGFVEMTREEYISQKAISEGITYEEAESIVDENIANAKSKLQIQTRSWAGNDTIDNGDSTYTIYGTVYDIYTMPGTNYQVKYSVSAIKMYHHYGSTWAEVTPFTNACYAYGSGAHTFIGVGTANLINNTQIRIAVSGTIEVLESTAVSAGYTLSMFSSSISTSSNTYWRYNVDDSHIETA